MSLCKIPTHAFLLILRYIGRPLDFMRMLTVSKEWRELFDISDTELWHTVSVEYDIVFNVPNLSRSLRSTTDHRKVFFRTYFKKQREMDDRHELLIVQAKAILEGVRDQPSKLLKLIEKLLPNQRYFNPDVRGKTMEDNTLLTLCCRYFQNKCIRMMVERFNADVNVPDVGGFTPLILCAYHGNFSGVLYLLKHNVDLLAVGRLRSGPRLIAEHWAAIQGHAKIFRYLHALRRRAYLKLEKKSSSSATASSVLKSTAVSAVAPAHASEMPLATEHSATTVVSFESIPTGMLLTKEDAGKVLVPPSFPVYGSSLSHSELQLPPLTGTTLGLFFSESELMETGDSNWSALTTSTLTAPPSLFSSSLYCNPFPVASSSPVEHSISCDVTSSSSSSSSSSNSSNSNAHTGNEQLTLTTESATTAVLPAIPATEAATPSEEALYCLCKRGYEGQMIGCDSADCPVEWYHYECVGLQARPAGQWLCGLCTADTKSVHTKSCLTVSNITPTDTMGKEDPFCICGHEGVGQMVSCDNARCLVQWFHFACVGLTAEPSGSWECPLCRGGTFEQPPLPLETAICPVIPAAKSHKGGKRGRHGGKSGTPRVPVNSEESSDVSSAEARSPDPVRTGDKSIEIPRMVTPRVLHSPSRVNNDRNTNVNGAGEGNMNVLDVPYVNDGGSTRTKRSRRSDGINV